MKICAYVQNAYAKANYKNECMDTRQFVGLKVIKDALERAGYEVEFAGIATVHQYDIVLISLTSDCDWWTYIQERLQWKKGSYKIIIGGAGVMHVTPFLAFGDYFSLGRGEESVVNLVNKLAGREGYEDDSIIDAKTFSENNTYHIRQATKLYPHSIPLSKTASYTESAIGCNHKCLFCGYTWHRKFLSERSTFRWDSGLFKDIVNQERAMLDLMNDPNCIDWKHLRSTALDGISERLRFMCNKRISRDMLEYFLKSMILQKDIEPHQMKFFNIVGLPTENEDDERELLDVFEKVDRETLPKKHKNGWGVVLSSMHFNQTPATPLACAPVSYLNHRQHLHNVLAPQLKGGYVYSGENLWLVEGMGTEHLASIEMRMVALRGNRDDTENIIRLCKTKKFWSANKEIQQATIEKYFNMPLLFGEFTPETLPSRYLRTYCKVEESWKRPAWKEPWIIKPKGKD